MLQVDAPGGGAPQGVIGYTVGLASTGLWPSPDTKIRRDTEIMRILLKILLVLALLGIVAVIGLVWIINTGQYRGTMEQAVADYTGYELQIAGDVDLDIFPTFGLTLNDVRLRNPAYPQELASSSAMVLRVDVRELIGGELIVRELLAEDFHVNYYVNADGSTIWDVEMPQREPEPDAEPGSSDEIGSLTVDRISIQNTSIDYQDLSQGLRYRVDDFNLESLDTNLAGRPFDLNIDFAFENNGMSEPVPVDFHSRITLDLAGGDIELADLRLGVTPLLLQGEMRVADFAGDLTFSGNLSAARFDARALLETLAMVDPEEEFSPGLDSARMAAFAVEFSGSQTEANVPNLRLELGDAGIEGNASVRFPTEFSPMNINYTLRGGDIDLTPLMASAEETPAGEAGPGADQAESEEADFEIPVETLGLLNLQGSASLASLRLDDMLFRNINVYTNIEDSVLDVEITPMSAFDGTLAGSLRLDGSAATPQLESNFTVSQFNILELVPLISQLDAFRGLLDLEASHTAQGATLNTMLESLTGSTAFSVNNSSVDVSLIKQVFTAIAALSPTGESIEQWPDVLRFSELGGYIALDEGLQINQDVKLRMDNFDISGSGGINLSEGSFDYDLLFTMLGEPHPQTVPINSRYHDIPWPVQCEAEFDAPASQYCRPDFSQVRQIFAQMGSNALRQRLEEEVTDQIPEDIQDAARGLLRNLLN